MNFLALRELSGSLRANVARKEENGDLNSKRHFIAKFRPRFSPRSESDLSLPNKWVTAVAQAVVR